MKKILNLLLAMALCAALLASCGAQSKGYPNSNINDAVGEMSTADSAAPNAAPKPGGGEGAALQRETTGSSDYGLKIIYNARLDIETLDFDKSCESVVSAVTSSGGYLSNTDVGGGYTYSGNYLSRYARYSARIPSAKYNEFLAKGETFGNITSSSNSSEDITTSYIDNEARLNTLKAQETRLLELLKESGTLEDLLAIEQRLSDVRYQIESITSTLKLYDNMVDFCTVEISLNEVNKITVNQNNFQTELIEAFKGSGRAVLNFMRGLVIFLIYALPFIAIALLILWIALKLTRKGRASKTARNARAAEAAAKGNFCSSPEPDGNKKIDNE
ncbi:MAG: DUF4349 domain-containing protein [Oscillospiraceae bacterium]